MTLKPTNWQEREQGIALVSFAAVTALIVIFLLRDASAFVNSAQDELIGHLGASGGFTVAAAGTYIVLRRERPSLLNILLAGSAITVAAELAQGLVPDRGVELRDIATGFGGVLVAAVGIEIVLVLCTLLVAQRVHAIVAAIASAILLVLLIFDLAPRTLSGASPDGERCPFTLIDGTGQRIMIGAAPVIDDDCLQTNAGGLGLFGPEGSNTLDAESVLLSSPLDVLVSQIIDNGGITITAEFVTGSFDDEVRPPGVIVILRSNEAGELLQIRTRDQAVETYGPTFPDLYRSSSGTQVLDPDTRYELQVELTADQLRVFIDGIHTSTSSVDPSWLDALADSDAADDLTLYVGNGPARTLPFRGVIEWLEIDT